MKLIVDKLTDSVSVPMAKFNGELIEPAFLALDQEADYCSQVVLTDHLAHKITKNRNDLRSHIQRIYLVMEGKNSKAVYSALVDLFLVLESSGLALRKRMLANARTLLSDFEFKALDQTLLPGLTTEIVLPMAKQALLTKGLGSTYQKFIHKIIK